MKIKIDFRVLMQSLLHHSLAFFSGIHNFRQVFMGEKRETAFYGLDFAIRIEKKCEGYL